LAEAMHALIGFDAIAANAFANDPLALASYEGVRSINKTRGRTMTAPETPPAPAVTSATAA
jgi:hypothetical protein